MLVRVLFALAVIAVAIDIYTIADIALTARNRLRSLNKFVWIVVVVLIPVVGAILWFVLGKSRASSVNNVLGADDDPNFQSPGSETSRDRIARLEDELRRLDDEENMPPDPFTDNPDEPGPDIR
ncbi:MAG: PLDc N-terminal domain-containing protein [Microbacteriaceae bacterium]